MRTTGLPLSANINWTFFSFAVVFPLTFSLNEAFKRRELALNMMAQLKARPQLRAACLPRTPLCCLRAPA